MAVWGAGYVATRAGLQYAPPFTFLTLRFCFGLLCLAPIVLFWKPRWPRSATEWAHLAAAGLLMHAVQLGGSHYAQYLGMSAGVAALIISCQPLATAVVASRFLKERLRPGQWLGIFVGLAGIALAGVTAATLYQRRFAPHADLKAAAVIQFAATAAVMAPLAFAVEGFTVVWAWELAVAIALLVILASLLGVSVLHYLMRHGEATRVTSMMYLPPIFACAGVAMTVWRPAAKSS